MKVRAAVLRAMGLPRPYAESRPLVIETLELSPPQREAFLAACARQRVLRGGATVTRARLRDARHRSHRLPEECHGLTGFRSCSL